MGLAPKLVVVALGANYRYGRCSERVVGREITDFLMRVDGLWGESPLVVLVPATEGREAVSGSCYERVPGLIAAAASRARRRRVSEGRPALLVSQMPALPASCLADEDGHPTAKGNARVVDLVMDELEKLDCHCLAELGEFGRCGACRHKATANRHGSRKAGERGGHADESHADDEAPFAPGSLMELPFE